VALDVEVVKRRKREDDPSATLEGSKKKRKSRGFCFTTTRAGGMLRWGATRHFSIEVIGRRVTRRSYAASSSQESTQRARPSSAGKHISRREQYQALPSDWKAVIGVEVHAQLKSNKKLFSSAPSDGMLASSSAAENSLVAPFDAALPGALPTLQMEPFQLALRACLALKCEIAEWTSFDRKHYFYPDLTSGYQISQKYGECGDAC
jgi:hypothetical protein